MHYKNHCVVSLYSLDWISSRMYFSISKFFSHFKSFWLGFGQFSVGLCSCDQCGQSRIRHRGGDFETKRAEGIRTSNISPLASPGLCPCDSAPLIRDRSEVMRVFAPDRDKDNMCLVWGLRPGDNTDEDECRQPVVTQSPLRVKLSLSAFLRHLPGFSCHKDVTLLW